MDEWVNGRWDTIQKIVQETGKMTVLENGTSGVNKWPSLGGIRWSKVWISMTSCHILGYYGQQLRGLICSDSQAR